MRLWEQSGIPTPKTYERSDMPYSSNCLAMEYFVANTLMEFLKKPDLNSDSLKVVLGLLFDSIAKRHQLALERDDIRFIHSDPHSGNVLHTENGLTFIDLERELPKHPVLKSAVWELSRWGRNVVDIAGRQHLDQVVDAVLDAYCDSSQVPLALVKQDYKPPRIQKLKERFGRSGKDTMRRYEFAFGLMTGIRTRKLA